MNHESRRKGERKGSKEEPKGKKRGKRREEEGREEGDRRKEWRKEIRGRRRGGDPHTRQGGPGRLLARECPPWRSWPRRPAGRRRVEGEGRARGEGRRGEVEQIAGFYRHKKEKARSNPQTHASI